MSEPRVVFCECGAYTMGFDPATSGEDEQCVIVITAGGEIVHRARTWERTAAVLVMKMDDLDKALARISALEAENAALKAERDKLRAALLGVQGRVADIFCDSGEDANELPPGSPEWARAEGEMSAAGRIDKAIRNALDGTWNELENLQDEAARAWAPGTDAMREEMRKLEAENERLKAEPCPLCAAGLVPTNGKHEILVYRHIALAAGDRIQMAYIIYWVDCRLAAQAEKGKP